MGTTRRPRGGNLLAVGVAVSMGLAWMGAASAVAGSAEPHAGARTGLGSQLWVNRCHGALSTINPRMGEAISPDGGTVYITGPSGAAYATVAIDAKTGARLWASRHTTPGIGGDQSDAVAVSPSGKTVFVTGLSFITQDHAGYLTIAYDAATGAQLWLKRYNGAANGVSEARSLTVSPDGRSVYVTGYSGTSTTAGLHADYVTVAYDAAIGAQRWLSRYDGRAHRNDEGRWLAVSPDGHTVYVTGRSQGRTSGYDYATVAYRAATGAQRWVSRYNGHANMDDFGAAVVAAPGGRTVYVTGGSRQAARSGLDFTTIAYNAATGVARWVSRYDGPAHLNDLARALAVTPNGRSVIVTGSSQDASGNFDYATVAYHAATGAPPWARRYPGTAGNTFDTPAAAALGLSPDGGTVFVTGTSEDGAGGHSYATLAYGTVGGARLWVSRFSGGDSQALAVVVSPGGGALYVTGLSHVGLTNTNFATVAYRT
jgi:hypothetical protein